jgi:two-component system OmpR family response regulator
MSAPILIVEDDASIREMLGDCLSEAGYQTASAANGVEALAHIQAGLTPSLILLDLAMPLMGGQMFLHLWRRGGHAPAPVIVLTADQKQHDHASALGVNRVLTKPIEIAAFLTTVAEFVAA